MMKKPAFLLASLAALAVAGCANLPDQRASTEVDMKYVRTVERNARNVGVDVKWVNPPRRVRAAEKEG